MGFDKDTSSQESVSTAGTQEQQQQRSKYYVPVDTEHKSTVLRLYELRSPHMRAFWLSTIAYFSAFVSTFAAASLLPVIRDDLDLNKTDVGNAGVASVCGAAVARILMGNFVDTFGPRYGIGLCLGMTAPAVFCMSMVQSATAFILVRFFIGLALANFVACQFWSTSMFTTKIVGTANALAGGWGTMGGGFTALVMPSIYKSIMNMGVPSFTAWRWAFFFPGALHVGLTLLVMLLAQDLPDGNYRELVASGAMAKPKGWPVWKAALTNYRMWVLALMYGYCFGTELTINNVMAQYLFDQFNLEITLAGILGGVFGMMNLFTRAIGGVLSDVAAKYYGMRGRLWCLWTCQTLAGLFCMVLGFDTIAASLGSTMGIIIVFSTFCQMANGLMFGVAPFVSKRSTGLVIGFTGAGGNVGSVVTQAAFFTSGAMSTQMGFVWLGVLTMAITTCYFLVYFPQWGGMLRPAKQGVTEEDYYLGEFTAEEIAAGMHTGSLKFAYESRSQRGFKAHQAALRQDASSHKGTVHAAAPVVSAV